MNKSMLVIDTPKSCSECKYNVGFGEGFLCSANYSLREDNKTTQRHPQCPLQDTSELVKLVKKMSNSAGHKSNMAYYDNLDKDTNKIIQTLGGKKDE